ncbi:barstar family protein [Streptomyces sp. NPDC000983]|uniref:barstar family protein n=1 Tax=Streptomyces sp. NPDC000983 TaxID=3154373 RepID=UPI003333EE9E
MAAFDADDGFAPDRALSLMWNTFVTLFWRRSLVDETVGWLNEHGYQTVVLDAGLWADEDALHSAVAEALDFPDYYGENLDALNDCLRDVVSYDYGTTKEATGLAIVFLNYDHFARVEPRAAQIVLDIFADRARSASLFGHRIMTLVHSNDPNIEFEPVGAMPVMWNQNEWFDAHRRPG